ncbi:CueP family metal-binding protein [Brevibacterium ammoniilyticum]|uniref:CueP family metal-binding protein n=1 Tax=Brevibacterium ammoniilyticum TaxID=1046555 RepID=UPI003138ADBF
MKRLAIAGVALTLALSGCASTGADDPKAEASASASAAAGFLSAYGMVGQDAVGIIDTLDRLTEEQRPTAFTASIEPDRLVLADAAGKVALPLPQDKSYVAIAPYVSQTHDCFYHSLTTCQGEMANTPVEVTIVDDATGKTLVKESTRTFDNGFVGFWLPRDVDGTVTISAGDRSGSATFSTQPDGATCITDLQLS